MSLEIGQILDGKYRIVRLLGEGGMGAVFEGENTRIKRRVAIKVLHAGVASNADVVMRFEREAQAAGRIGSEHIVEVLDLGQLPGGERYLVMEYLDGDSLSGRIEKSHRLGTQLVLPLVSQLLDGLRAAHAAGIVHRDLKPDNVFILRERGGRPDFVKILDFGISKFSPLASDEGMSMTRTGAVMGTPYYMSPEQAKGEKEIDARSDLFSVGVILYQAVTGRVPFDGETFNELMFKIALQDPPAPEELVAGLEPSVGDIIRRAMAREPAARFQTAEEFKQAIDQCVVRLSAPPGQATQSLPPPQATQALSTAQTAFMPSPPVQPVGGTNQPPTLSGVVDAPLVAPVRKSGPLVGIAAVVGLVVLIGAFFGARAAGLFGGGAEPASAAAPPEAPTSVTMTDPPPDEDVAPVPPSPAETAEPDATALAAASAAPAEAAAATSKPTAVAPRPTATSKSTAAKPQPTSAPVAQPAAGGAKAGGRPIRTGL